MQAKQELGSIQSLDTRPSLHMNARLTPFRNASVASAACLGVGILAFAVPQFQRTKPDEIRDDFGPGFDSSTITFPDGSVGAVQVLARQNNNRIGADWVLFQTIPDATGRGMKTRVTKMSTGTTLGGPCSISCSTDITFTNP